MLIVIQLYSFCSKKATVLLAVGCRRLFNRGYNLPRVPLNRVPSTKKFYHCMTFPLWYSSTTVLSDFTNIKTSFLIETSTNFSLKLFSDKTRISHFLRFFDLLFLYEERKELPIFCPSPCLSLNKKRASGPEASDKQTQGSVRFVVNERCELGQHLFCGKGTPQASSSLTMWI